MATVQKGSLQALISAESEASTTLVGGTTNSIPIPMGEYAIVTIYAKAVATSTGSVSYRIAAPTYSLGPVLLAQGAVVQNVYIGPGSTLFIDAIGNGSSPSTITAVGVTFKNS